MSCHMYNDTCDAQVVFMVYALDEYASQMFYEAREGYKEREGTSEGTKGADKRNICSYSEITWR